MSNPPVEELPESTRPLESAPAPPASARDLFAIFEISPTPQLLVSPDDPTFTLLAASEAFLRMNGTARNRLIGRGFFEIFPTGADALRASLGKVLAEKQPDHIRHPYGAWNSPVLAADGSVAYILHSAEPHRQAAENKQSRRDALLVRLDDATRSLFDPAEIVRVACRLLSAELGVDRCSYCTFEPDQETVHITSEYAGPGVPVLTGRNRISGFGADLARSLRDNSHYVAHDIQTPEASAAGIRSMVTIPLHRGGRLVAALGVSHCQKPRTWQPDDVELVSAVANRFWESMERAYVTRELRASEQRLRLSQRAARIGSFEWLMTENRMIWTPELEALYGLAEGSFDGTLEGWSRLVVPEDAAQVLALIADCTARRESECSYEFRVVLPGGAVRWLRAQTQFFYDAAGVPERMLGVNIDNTAQKEAEAALKRSEERLRAIFHGTCEYIGLLSPDGTLLEANRASLEFAGNTREDVVGRPFWETPWFVGTPGAPETVRQAVAQAAAGQPVRFEATLRRPSGETPTFDISLNPVTNPRGEAVVIVPEGRDITERKLAEDRLHRQWLIFDTALSNTPDLIYTFDREGRFTYANRQLCLVSQRSLKDTVGRTVAELGYPSELAARIANQVRHVVETGQSLRDETAFTLRTGEIREYEYIYAPVIGEDGQVNAIAGSTRDVTERKLAELQLRRSEAQFRQLFDSLPQLVWSSTPEGYDDLFNRQWFDYTGLSLDELQGDGGKIIHPEDLPLARQLWKRSLQTAEPYEIEYRCRRFDGQYRWFLARARPVADEQGRVVRWFGTCTDIHDKKQSETALRKAHRELEEFSYVASHDLQEPLRMVTIYSQLILKHLGVQEGSVADYARFVRQGAKRMETLMADLLKFSQAVHTEALPGVADLSVALAEARSVLSINIEETGAVITAPLLPTVQGDTRQLAHVFQNLLSNSLKYRKPDHPPEIQITAERRGSDWIVSVRDNGIGFEPQYAERIFGLFKRLHKGEYPGTGLGLAICQRIVERYGGRMWAEGMPGEGAVFHFSLPSLPA